MSSCHIVPCHRTRVGHAAVALATSTAAVETTARTTSQRSDPMRLLATTATGRQLASGDIPERWRGRGYSSEIVAPPLPVSGFGVLGSRTPAPPSPSL